MNILSKIGLGTAQFGLDYGINNATGQIVRKEAIQLLTLANQKSICTLDTAHAYGNAQKQVGEILNTHQLSFKIISKIPPEVTSQKSLVETFDQTLNDLQQTSIEGLLFHRVSDFLKYPALWETMVDLKEQGKVNKIGFSLYSVTELEDILRKEIPFQLVQLQYNVFDQRFKDHFSFLKKMGVEIHTRSVFLQGLFFMNDDTLPQFFDPIRKKLRELQMLATNTQIPLNAMLLHFVLQNEYIDKVIIGVDNLENLQENIQSITYWDKSLGLYELLESFEEKHPQIINPSNWVIE